MTGRVIGVLFLCTRNSDRSILAEATLNHIGASRFKAFSAGSSLRENQQPDPLALQVLSNAGIPTGSLRSKSWDEFGRPDSPVMDLVIAMCDDAAGEVSPVWPGQPATAHWCYTDPSANEGSEAQKLQAFRLTFHAIHRRLDLLASLPAIGVDKLVLQTRARHLARS